MQPLQYDLRDPAAQESSIAHAAAVPRNLDAAITMRCAASRRKPARIYAHGNTRWQQPCSHSTAICIHRFKTRIELRTQEQPLVAEHRGGTSSRMKRPQPHPPHTRGTFHRRLQPLYTEKHKVSCSGFLPKTKPMQHSCSHSNAICNHSFKKHKELRTQEQPLVAKHIEGTNRVRNDRSRPRRAHEVPFIAAWIHFTRKNTRFRAPASSPKMAHATFMQPFQMRSATTASRNTKNYAHRNNHSLQNT